uniref:UmuC domain-containing protein n=1 Tax=Macrostomum lignano TaxID=282301 RepID=A0A1I8FLU6_9PLAT
ADLFRQEWTPSLVDKLAQRKARSQRSKRRAPIARPAHRGDASGPSTTTSAHRHDHRGRTRACTASLMPATPSPHAQSHQRAFVMEGDGRHCGYLCAVSALCIAKADLSSLIHPRPRHREPGNAASGAEHHHRGLRAPSTLRATPSAPTSSGHDQPEAEVRYQGHRPRPTCKRGGAPSAFDRLLGCRMAAEALLALLDARQNPRLPSIVVSLDCQSGTAQAPGLLPRLVVGLCGCRWWSRRAWPATKAVNEAIQAKNYAQSVEPARQVLHQQPGHLPDPEEAATRPPNACSDSCPTLLIVMVGAPPAAPTPACAPSSAPASTNGFRVLGCQRRFRRPRQRPASPAELGVRVRPDVLRRQLPRTKRITARRSAIAAVAEALSKACCCLIGGFEAFSSLVQLFQARPSQPALAVPMLRRVFVVETMGGYCGYLATLAGLAGGACGRRLHQGGQIRPWPCCWTMCATSSQKMHDDCGPAAGPHSCATSSPTRNYSTDFVYRVFKEEARASSTAVPTKGVLTAFTDGGGPKATVPDLSYRRHAHRPYEPQLAPRSSGVKAADWFLFRVLSGGACGRRHRGRVGRRPARPSWHHRGTSVRPGDGVLSDTRLQAAHAAAGTQWWLKLRPLLRILAKHDSVLESDSRLDQPDDHQGRAGRRFAQLVPLQPLPEQKEPPPPPGGFIVPPPPPPPPNPPSPVLEAAGVARPPAASARLPPPFHIVRSPLVHTELPQQPAPQPASVVVAGHWRWSVEARLSVAAAVAVSARIRERSRPRHLHRRLQSAAARLPSGTRKLPPPPSLCRELGRPPPVRPRRSAGAAASRLKAPDTKAPLPPALPAKELAAASGGPTLRSGSSRSRGIVTDLDGSALPVLLSAVREGALQIRCPRLQQMLEAQNLQTWTFFSLLSSMVTFSILFSISISSCKFSAAHRPGARDRMPRVSARESGRSRRLDAREQQQLQTRELGDERSQQAAPSAGTAARHSSRVMGRRSGGPSSLLDGVADQDAVLGKHKSSS